MRLRRRLLLGMLGLALCLPQFLGSRALADGNSSIAIANRYVNQHTVAGIRLDLDRLDLLKQSRRVDGLIPLTPEERGPMMQGVGLADAAIEGMVSSGADEIYVLFDARRMDQGVTVVLTIAPDKANDETAELLKSTIEYLVPEQARNGMVFEARADHVIFGFPDAIAPKEGSTHRIPAFVSEDRLQTATLFACPSADHLRAARETLQPLPPPFETFDLRGFATDMNFAAVDVQLEPSIAINAMINSPNEQGASHLAVSLNGLFEKVIGLSGIEREFPELVERLATLEWQAEGNQCVYRLTEESIGLDTLAPIFRDRVEAARGAASRSVMSNNQKQILLALHNYHDSHGKFPTNIKDENGNDILSWRVLLLPYLEQQALYNAIKMNEPWNSEANLRFAELVVPVYACPLYPELPPGKTLSMFIEAEGTLITLDKDTSFRDVTDGTSNTIALVMADPARAVHWMAPDDLEIDLEHPHDGLFWVNDEVTLVGFLDGSVRALAKSIDGELLRRLYQPADGQVVGPID